MDKTYITIEPVGAHRVVVAATSAGSDGIRDMLYVKLASRSGEGRIVGLTLHSQDHRGGKVVVRKAGIAKARTFGDLRRGEPVLATEDGKVIPIRYFHGMGDNSVSPSQVECLGYAETGQDEPGKTVEVMISLHGRDLTI